MSRKKTHEEFLSQVSELPIEIIGQYETSRTKIDTRCAIDGHEWGVTPSDLLNGSGCPLCWEGRRRKKNVILRDNGGWLEVDVSTRKHKDAIMKINKDDWDDVSNMTHGRVVAWRPTNNRGVYCVALVGGLRVGVHRLIMEGTHQVVDHVNGDCLDNRKINLRPCTYGENSRNRRVAKNNTSGYTGVCFAGGRWRATIYVKGKNIYLGFYEKFEDACRSRKDAEIKYYGEFAPCFGAQKGHI